MVYQSSHIDIYFIFLLIVACLCVFLCFEQTSDPSVKTTFSSLLQKMNLFLTSTAQPANLAVPDPGWVGGWVGGEPVRPPDHLPEEEKPERDRNLLISTLHSGGFNLPGLKDSRSEHLCNLSQRSAEKQSPAPPMRCRTCSLHGTGGSSSCSGVGSRRLTFSLRQPGFTSPANPR